MAREKEGTPEGEEQETPPEDGGEQPTPEERLAELEQELGTARAEITRLKKQRAPKPKPTPKKDEPTTDEDEQERERKIQELESSNSKLERQLQKANALGIAADLKIVDPDAAIQLLDWDSLEDPDSKTEIRNALKTLVKEKPYLLSTESGGFDGGQGGSGGQKPSMNDRIRAAAGRR